MRRWNNRTKMMIGMVRSTAAGAMEPVGSANCDAPVKFAIATVAVWDRWVEVREIANRKSFQQKMNTRIAVVNTPGAASGTITDRNACSGVAPSILAAFSSSHGISRKNAESV